MQGIELAPLKLGTNTILDIEQNPNNFTTKAMESVSAVLHWICRNI